MYYADKYTTKSQTYTVWIVIIRLFCIGIRYVKKHCVQIQIMPIGNWIEKEAFVYIYFNNTLIKYNRK